MIAPLLQTENHQHFKQSVLMSNR